MGSKQSYIKSDDNTIINEKCIIWIKRWGDCLEVSTTHPNDNKLYQNTHTICKSTSLHSYNKLNKHFEYFEYFE